MKKRILSLAVILTLVCTMFVPAAMADSKTTLRVAWWGGQARNDLMAQMISNYEAKHPDVKVSGEFADFSNFWSKLATQVAGGQEPDVIAMDLKYLKMYATSGVLYPLDEYYNSGAIDVSGVASSVIESGMVDGVSYALCTGTNAPAMFYRKDVLDEAGVEMPMEPTMAQYMEIAKTVAEKTGRKVNALNGVDELNYTVRNHGLQFYNEDGTGLGFDDPSYVVAMWQRYLDGVAEGSVTDITEATHNDRYDVFITDEWASAHFSNELAGFQDGSGCKLSLCMFPTFEDGTVPPTFIKPSQFVSITKNSKNKDIAADFINFWTNDLEGAGVLGAERGIPISASIREYLKPNLSEDDQRVYDYMDYIAQDGKTSKIMNPDPSSAGEVGDLFNEYTEAVQYGGVDDLEAWAKEWMSKANTILAEAAAKAEK